MHVKGKKITLVGLGESTLAAAFFLKDRGASVFVSEGNISDSIRLRAETLQSQGIECEIGGHTTEKVMLSDMVVISPGIAPQTEIFQRIHKAQIDIISEIELASCFCPNDIIAITGTDGKTTVTTLITEILNGCGLKARSCGNIGNPFIGEINQLDKETKVVIEVSSFQLYTIKQFRPKVAVLTNIAPDHLNWHYNYDDYVNAKMKLFQNQTSSDYVILNFTDKDTAEFLCRIKAKKLFFNQFETDLDPNKEAAFRICDVYDLDKAKAREILHNFKGVEHRLEHVDSSDGIVYINDSKATSLHALEWGLNRQKNKVILLCGGRNKGLDFTTMRDTVSAKAKHVICFGEARHEIRAAWEGAVPLSERMTVAEAFSQARTIAQPGDVVLFSPACTSFDEFKNYCERGRHFKDLVRR
jgi:UDP-N-acetylmuramoylalanine--D-glutamate ligase